MLGFEIGLSALAAGRRGLETVGQNVANATTPGYHRQSLRLTGRVTAGTTGSGVDVAALTRYDAPPLRTAIRRGNAEAAAATARLDSARQVETALGTGDQTISSGVDALFTEFQGLTSRPSEPAARRTAVAAAATLAGRLNAAATAIDTQRVDVGTQVGRTVGEVNDYAARIAQYNARIAKVTGAGGQAHDLMDQRDQLVDDLSQRVEVRTVSQPDGTVNVLTAGAAMVVGDTATAFQVGPDTSGRLVVTQTGSDRPVGFESGTLGGQLRAYNTDLPAARGRLDALARELVRGVNQVHATGLGTTGPLAAAAGSVPVPDPAAPLAGQPLPFPVKAGQLVVSVTDTATGQRTNSTVAIDPSTQSLQDVAAAITGGTGGAVRASVDLQTNTLRLQARDGSKFDFAGRAPNPANGAAAVADPDTAGVLSALGVNGLFAGTDAGSVAVRPDVASDPERLAGSRSGEVGDASNFVRLAGVAERPAVGGRTLSADAGDIAATVGADVRSLGDAQTAHTGVVQSLFSQEQSSVGVDVNEEMVHLLDYQRMVQSASSYMSAVNTALDSVLQIVR